MGWDGPMTHRQYLAWQRWLMLQWNVPSRSDWYLMRITQAMAGGSLQSKKIQWSTGDEGDGEASPLSPVAETAILKAKHRAMMGPPLSEREKHGI